jgi:predicted nucleotidyltransferase
MEELIEELLKLFNENKIKYVIIGGMALPVYGYARATFDLDIFIEPTEENAKKTLKVLSQFGYKVVEDVKLSDFLNKKTLIRGYNLEIDIHPFVKGVSFNEVWKNRVKAKIGSTFGYFPSLENLIKMKKAANRAKDKEDLKYLKEFFKRRRKK